MGIKRADQIKPGDVLPGGAKVIKVTKQGSRVILSIDNGLHLDERADQKLHVK